VGGQRGGEEGFGEAARLGLEAGKLGDHVATDILGIVPLPGLPDRPGLPCPPVLLEVGREPGEDQGAGNALAGLQARPDPELGHVHLAFATDHCVLRACELARRPELVHEQLGGPKPTRLGAAQLVGDLASLGGRRQERQGAVAGGVGCMPLGAHGDAAVALALDPLVDALSDLGPADDVLQAKGHGGADGPVGGVAQRDVEDGHRDRGVRGVEGNKRAPGLDGDIERAGSGW